MIEGWLTQKPIRFLFGVSALLAGGIVVKILITINLFTTSLFLFTISLAALIGAGKLASP
jgi:hypothetical protein